MVSVKSTIVASAFAISAVNAADVTPEQNADLLVIISDIEAHAADYIGLETSNSGFEIPSQVLSLYAAIATYTDQSFTTLFSELDVSALTATITNLPWYSTRLLPSLERANAQFSSNSSESASASATASSNATESVASASSSSADNSTVAVSTSVSASASITGSGNSTAEETGVASRNSSSIRHSSSSHSSSEKKNSTSSTNTKSEKNGAEYIGSSSGLLFAGLAALLL